MPFFLSSRICILTLSLLMIPGFMARGQEKKSVSDADSLRREYGQWSRFSFGLGGFFAGYDSGIALGASNAGIGVIVDIEDALGISSTTFAYRAYADFRFGKNRRNQLMMGFFTINRNALKVLEQEIELGDNIYGIGTEISSKYNFSIIRLKYNYAFLQDERISMAASFGLFIMPLSFRLEAPNLEAQATQFVAPLPLAGLGTIVRLTPKLQLTQNTELLYIAVSGVEGTLLDLALTLDYSLSKNFDLGLGVNSNRIGVRMLDDSKVIDFFGDIKMAYTGAMIYVKYNIR